jgi:L-asparaginase
MLTACSRCRQLRELLLAVLVIPLLLDAPCVFAGQPDSLPTIRLIATGGTISSRPGGRLTAEQLIESIPFLDRYVVSETEQFDNVASSMLTLDQWLKLSRRVNELLSSRPDLTGIVVTTGTDTLEETAFFLHLTVRSDKPVVVVGSMRPPQSLSYDGAANLLQGFRVAADDASRGKGVLVVLNNEINSAREVSKTNTQSLQAFYAPGYGVLGFVDTDRVSYYRRTERRHTASSEFDVTSIDRLPRVDVLLSYQDAPGDLIRHAVEAGAAGIVVAAAGAGSVSRKQHEAIETVSHAGTPVVVTSRTGRGRVPTERQVGRQVTPGQGSLTAQRIGGEDLSPVKARILLMLALAVTTDLREIQRMFTEY